jgi:serine/threonine protein kinase
MPSSRIGGKGYKAPEMLMGEQYTGSVDWWNLGVLVYQILSGNHPMSSGKTRKFLMKDRDKATLAAGGKGQMRIKYIKRASQAANHFAAALLNPKPSARLGSGPRGTEDVKNHAFFDGIDWEQLAKARWQHERLVPPLSSSKMGKIADPDERPKFKNLEVVFGALLTSFLTSLPGCDGYDRPTRHRAAACAASRHHVSRSSARLA